MRTITTRRLVALGVIAVVTASLAYLRFAPGPAPISVPAGARAGDLTLQPCTYSTESGDYVAECGRLIVNENRANPATRLIALPLTRIKASSANPQEPLFYLEGGPGLSNMTFKQASRFAVDRDVVLVGYRGIDGSVRLDCPEVPLALQQSPDVLGDESFRAYGDAYRACVDRLTNAGFDPTAYGLPRQVEDMEAARVALGYEHIDLLSQSAGTRTAMIYAWRYPERIHRSVMIGVNPPGHFLFDSRETNQQISRYGALCAADANCRQRTDDLAGAMQRTAAAMPERWLFLPVKAGNVRVSTLFGLWETNSVAGTTLDAWLSAADGDPSGFWLQSLVGDLITTPFIWGQYAAAATLDAQMARDYFSTDAGQDRTSLGWAGSAYAWGGGQMADAWPAAPDADAYTRVRTSEVETLLISGALDSATPPDAATHELLPYLPNGHQVVLPAHGHISSVFTEQPEAGTHLINTFLASGRVDDSLYEPQTVDFAPATTLTSLARMVAGMMLGVGLLAVVSLAWMAHRVHRRGHLGDSTGATLRVAYLLVLGLGGWFLIGMIVTAAVPAIRLNHAVLVTVAAAAAAGLGSYFAWVHREWSANIRTTGLVAAIAGALLGAWLGFGAAASLPALVSGLVAPLTAIVGAAVGANLTLLVLDIYSSSSIRFRVTANWWTSVERSRLRRALGRAPHA